MRLRKDQSWWLGWLAAGTFTLASTSAWACNVPVFRFALERWRPDPYRVLLVHDGPLGEAERGAAEPVQKAADEEGANVHWRTVDAATLDDDLRMQLNAADSALALPSLVVHYPEPLQIAPPAWTARVSRESADRLLRSPRRDELVKRLVEGDSAVWVLLESGDPARDDAVAALLERELTRLEQELKLPELTESPDDTLLIKAPLELSFSLLRVSRTEPAEATFVATLLRSEPDLAERDDPLVFPVFGRGRALFPLVGPGITAANIQDAATFLVGPCSCQVKEQNPGFDLLLAADWDRLLSLEGVPLTAVATQGRVAPAGPVELIPIPRGSGSKEMAAENLPPHPAPSPAEPRATPAATAETVTGMPPASGRLNGFGIALVSGLVAVGLVAAGLLAFRS